MSGGHKVSAEPGSCSQMVAKKAGWSKVALIHTLCGLDYVYQLSYFLHIAIYHAA